MRNEPNPKSYETHVPINCDLPASPHTQSSGLTLLATRKFLPLHFAQSLDRMAWMKDLGGCCLARWRSRGNTKKILVHACSCECITYADEKVPSHKSLKDVFGIVIVWVFVKERRWLDCRHSVSNITSIHFRPSTVNGKPSRYKLLDEICTHETGSRSYALRRCTGTNSRPIVLWLNPRSDFVSRLKTYWVSGISLSKLPARSLRRCASCDRAHRMPSWSCQAKISAICVDDNSKHLLPQICSATVLPSWAPPAPGRMPQPPPTIPCSDSDFDHPYVHPLAIHLRMSLYHLQVILSCTSPRQRLRSDVH